MSTKIDIELNVTANTSQADAAAERTGQKFAQAQSGGEAPPVGAAPVGSRPRHMVPLGVSATTTGGIRGGGEIDYYSVGPEMQAAMDAAGFGPPKARAPRDPREAAGVGRDPGNYQGDLLDRGNDMRRLVNSATDYNQGRQGRQNTIGYAREVDPRIGQEADFQIQNDAYKQRIKARKIQMAPGTYGAGGGDDIIPTHSPEELAENLFYERLNATRMRAAQKVAFAEIDPATFGGDNKALSRIVGGRPRGLVGMASVAGASLIAGDVARTLRSQFDIENPEIGSGSNLMGAMASHIPILGGAFQAMRMSFGDTIHKEVVVQQSHQIMRQYAVEHEVQGARGATEAHIALLRQGTISPAADAAAAAHFQAAVGARGETMVTREPLFGIRSGETGARALGVAVAESNLAGAQFGLTRSAGQITESENKLVDLKERRIQVASDYTRAVHAEDFYRGLKNNNPDVLGGPLYHHIDDKYVREMNDETITNALKEAERTGKPVPGWTRGRISARHINPLLEEAAANVVGQGNNVLRINQQQQQENEKLKERQAFHQKMQDKVEIERGNVEDRRLELNKQEQYDVLHAQTHAIKGGLSQIAMMGPGRQQQWVDAVKQVSKFGIESTNIYQRELLAGNDLSNPWIQPMLRQAGENAPGVADAINIVAPAGRRGNLAQRQTEEEDLEKEILQLKAKIAAKVKEGISGIADQTAASMASTFMEIFAKIEDKLRQDAGLSKIIRRHVGEAAAGQ